MAEDSFEKPDTAPSGPILGGPDKPDLTPDGEMPASQTTHEMGAASGDPTLGGPGKSGLIPETKTSVSQTVKELGASLNGIIVSAAAVLAIVVFVFSGHRDIVLRTLASAGIVALTCGVQCALLLWRKKQLSTLVVILTSSVVAAGVIGAYISHESKATAVAARKNTLHFISPHPDAQHPVEVQCSQNIGVAGYLPRGDSFAVGNVATGQVIGDALPVFIPSLRKYGKKPGRWEIPQFFGDSSDSGKTFAVYLVVMPTSELKYLSQEAQQVRAALATTLIQKLPANAGSVRQNITGLPGQVWWIAPGLPPGPSMREGLEFAQLSSAKC